MNLRSIIDLDAQFSSQMRVAEKPGALRSMAAFFAHSGDSWFWGVALVLLWFFSNSIWRRWEVVEFGSISLLVVLVMSIKFLVRRRRPEGEWGSIYRNTDPHSFPSGHAARAFLIAVVASALAPAWLGILLWIWAPLVSIARVAMGLHYVSDVVAGAMLGIVVALIGLQIYEPLFLWLTKVLGFSFW
jgi:membrane-associated phospholipid phosphatase